MHDPAGARILNNMVEQCERDAPAAVFAALGDAVRCEIVVALRSGPATVSELAARFPITLQAVSRHVGILEAADVVHRTRAGRSRTVSLIPETLAYAAAWLVPQRPADSYDRLDDLLRRQGHGDSPSIRLEDTALVSATHNQEKP